MTDSTTPITQRIATKAVITDGKGRMLILREANTYVDGTNIGRYGVPGGRLDIGEPYMEGLKREVMEESGLQVEVGRPIYVGEWFPVIKGIPNQIVAIFFACTAMTEDVRLSEDHDSFEWITPDEIDSYDLMPPESDVLKEFAKLFL